MLCRALVILLTLTLVFSFARAKQDVTVPTVDESRFLFPTAENNTLQVSGIAVIGATLIGIAIALAVGGLLPAFTGALAGTGNFGKRSIPDDDLFDGSGSNPFSWLHLLAMIEGVKNFNVADVDCQKKMVCEIHRQGTSVSGRNIGVLSDKIFDVFNYIDPRAEDDETSLLGQFLEAAKKGKTKEDCERLYSSCQYSVRKVIRSLQDDN